MCKGKYSPKIDEALISALYRLAKEQKKPMTVLVKEIIAKHLQEVRHGNGSLENSA